MKTAVLKVTLTSSNAFLNSQFPQGQAVLKLLEENQILYLASEEPQATKRGFLALFEEHQTKLLKDEILPLLRNNAVIQAEVAFLDAATICQTIQ